MYFPFHCPACEKGTSIELLDEQVVQTIDCPHCHREVKVEISGGYICVTHGDFSWKCFLGINCFVEVKCHGCKKIHKIDFLSQIKLDESKVHTVCWFVCKLCGFEKFLILPNEKLRFSHDISDQLIEIALDMGKAQSVSPEAWKRYVIGKAKYYLKAISRGEKIYESGKDLPCQNLIGQAPIGALLAVESTSDLITDGELEKFHQQLGKEGSLLKVKDVLGN